MQFEPELPAYRNPGIGPDGKNHGFYASGSGFSTYFPRPKYQDGTVDKYVAALNGKYEGLYNCGEFLCPSILLPQTSPPLI